MRCVTCGTEVDEHVFAGGTVRCAGCGAAATMAASGQLLSGNPYREPATGRARSPSSIPIIPREGLASLCPRCTRGLEQADGSEELLCGKCQGVFVTHADLAARIHSERPSHARTERPRHASSRPSESAVRYGRCPACGDVMTRMNFGRHSGIVVDVCRSHGTWFDQGELDSILAYVRAGGLESETEARRDRTPEPDDQSLTRALEAELSTEWMKEKRSVQRGQIVEDLLSLLR